VTMARITFKQTTNMIDGKTLDKFRNSIKVTVTAAMKLDDLNYISLKLNIYGVATHTIWSIRIHNRHPHY